MLTFLEVVIYFNRKFNVFSFYRSLGGLFVDFESLGDLFVDFESLGDFVLQDMILTDLCVFFPEGLHNFFSESIIHSYVIVKIV